MFMITPKSIALDIPQKSSLASPSQPTIRAIPRGTSRAARVQKACDRCRLRKIKCDGDVPCLRCGQDKVLCAQSRRRPGDPKSLTREYIASLEQRQADLVRTFQQVFEHVPIDADVKRKISVTLEAQGIDPEHFFVHLTDDVENPSDESSQNLKIPCLDNESIPLDFMDISVDDTYRSAKNNGINSAETYPYIDLNELSSVFPRQSTQTENASLDDYWNLSDDWNQMPSFNTETDHQGVQFPPWDMVDQIYLPMSLTSQSQALANGLHLGWDDLPDQTLNMDEIGPSTT